MQGAHNNVGTVASIEHLRITNLTALVEALMGQMGRHDLKSKQ